MKLDVVSNGLGGQSMYLLLLACRKLIPATVSITGDTGSENDMLRSDGRRTTSPEFFEEVVRPMAERHGVAAYFVRAVDGEGNPRRPLHEVMLAQEGNAASGFGFQPAPLFGSGGGRLRQVCTDLWKISAIRQQARRLGAKKLRCAIGIHAGEATRRVRGQPLGQFKFSGRSFREYQTCRDKKNEKPVLWARHYYPLVDWRMDREACRAALEAAGVPYLVTTECDHCPHKDKRRWLDTSPETVARLTAMEEKYEGEFFLAEDRIPLPLALDHYRRLDEQGLVPKAGDGFPCSTNYCGI